MMNRKRYYLLSVLSGCVWALIALLLSFRAFGWSTVGGVVAAPFIGLLVGLIYHPAYRFPKLVQVFVSLLTLYLAAALFGLAVGTYDAFSRDIPNRITSAVIMEGMWATLWGVTFTGYIALLWPLAFFNHRLLGNASRAT